MAKPKDKACRICRAIYELSSDKCPNCGSKESTDSYKGKIHVLNHEKSEIADKLNLKSNGKFAIKTR
ncbi:MAG: DNA-binding protein [Nanoarchaeota archaeon]|nr:DNA-binding protein [Nanoarchaeota archaeon]